MRKSKSEAGIEKFLIQARQSSFLAPFKAFKAAIVKEENSEYVSLYYMMFYLRLFGMCPFIGETLFYRCNSYILITLMSIFLITLTCDLYEASSDFMTFGDDLVLLLGLYIVFYKMFVYRYRFAELATILEKFNNVHVTAAGNSVGSLEIKKLQRKAFIYESALFVFYLALGSFLLLAICIHPIFTHEPLPYRAKFPFNLQSPTEHPNFVCAIYVFQSCCTALFVLAVILIDVLGAHCISQTALNLRILCLKMRYLNPNDLHNGLREIVHFHQMIIQLADDVNNCFYSTYVAQMAISTMLICLAAFETLYAKDQPLKAMKFFVYMVSAFVHLFYWCFVGNMAYFDSLEVATAAYDVDNWYGSNKEFKRNLLFVILRAQKPLIFRPKPLVGFHFVTFTSILSTSYSYLALLRTMIE